MKFVSGLIILGLVVAFAHAVNYPEQEPNNAFPPLFLTSDPLIQPGDSLVGSLSVGDVDQHYFRMASPAVPGIYRYTFDLTASGQDTVLEIFDASAEGHVLSRNDDYPTRNGESVAVFEHVNLTGEGWTAGVRARMYAFNGSANTTRVTMFRTKITPDNLLVLPTGTTSRTANNGFGGSGNWYQFTLDRESNITIDTLGSPVATDTEIVLINATTGETLAASDDINRSLNNYWSKIDTHLPAGTYYLAVGRYRMAFNFDPATQLSRNWLVDGFGLNCDGFTTSASFTVNFRVTPTEYSPAAYTIGSGELLSGDLNSFVASDDNRLVLLSDPLSLKTSIECTARAFQFTAGSMRILCETSSERAGLSLTVRGRRYSDNQWVALYGQTAPGSDEPLEVLLTSTANDFLGDTGELALRLDWEPINDEDPSQDGWATSVDQVRWTLSP